MSLRSEPKARCVSKFVVKMERAVSIGLRRQWTKVAFGKTRWMRPSLMKLPSALSVTRFASGPYDPQRRQILGGDAPRRFRGRSQAPNVLAGHVAQAPELQFASRRHLRMARQDLFDQSGSATGHAHDQDGSRVLDAGIGLVSPVAGRSLRISRSTCLASRSRSTGARWARMRLPASKLRIAAS